MTCAKCSGFDCDCLGCLCDEHLKEELDEMEKYYSDDDWYLPPKETEAKKEDSDES